MAFSSPSPSSSSADSHSSYSPRLAASDLSLDLADPLNFLLNNNAMDDSAPVDFNQWPENDFNTQMKPYGDMDFSDLASLSMDIDYVNAIAVEPSALHFNSAKYNNFNPHYGFDAQSASYTDEYLAPPFPFTFQANHDPSSPSDSSSMQSSSSGRRLSISSSVSSSGASLSPVPEPAPSPSTAKATEFVPNNYPAPEPSSGNASSLPVPSASDPAMQLAERVRQSAGVMLALPMTAQLQAYENQQAELTALTSPSTGSAAPKLPIPRLPRHMSQSQSPSISSSAASTPPPSTPLATTAPLPVARPKTSHTTIERRYRTNLNARIQSLRMAVPALRVVEDREGGKKRAPNKVLVSSDPLKVGGEDVVDERGFVDGVKVARKCSKANVLGKAVEYIRVLKKREGRLKREQAGLKSLVSGLVGGPALLKEWEREWRECFGGEEKDEVEGEAENDGDEDDEDDDGDDDGDDEEGGRKRKRGKIAPAPVVPQVKQEKKEKKIMLAPDGTVPEKRKRGRPRKVVPVPDPVPAPTSMPVDQPQTQQYLLAIFALFSFFNSPLTSSSSQSGYVHVHTGTVLNGSVPIVNTPGSSGFTYYLQAFHLLVSIVVLLSFVSDWAGIELGKPRSSLFSFFSLRSQSRNEDKRTPADWVRLGETCALSSSSTDATQNIFSVLQIYYNITSWTNAQAADLVTAALVLYSCSTVPVLGSLARAKARTVWTVAGAKASGYEKLVLDNLSVDEAAKRLTLASIDDDSDIKDERGRSIRLLASSLIRERVRTHLGALFVGGVRGSCEDDSTDADEKEKEKELTERRRTIEAAKELDGQVGELGRRLEKLWKVPGTVDTEAEDLSGDSEGEMDGEEALMEALVLYRKVFAATTAAGNAGSALMSPPPSPGRKPKESNDVGRLRRALGSRVFEEGGNGSLEDARDRVVDMVVELERSSIGLN